MQKQERPQIVINKDGPYRISGGVDVYDTDGKLLCTDGIVHLCRCGGSRNKPFCDVTHGLKGFIGTEAADHSEIADRRATYQGNDGVTVYDDRSRCAHFGQCTTRLASVFRADAEPFVAADAASGEQIADVVAGCPSGALAFARGADPTTIEVAERASIHPIVDGPYRVRGLIEVIGADGVAYEVRERQTLCRCGQSRNRPFCDGSHWYAGFRDPVPAELIKQPPTLYDYAGGIEALERLTEAFYDEILSEPCPVLEPVFRSMDRSHPKHVAAWLAETFGGPATYTHDHGGYEHMVAKHQNLGLTEVQRKRWVGRMVETADRVGLPDDPDFRSAFVSYLEWGTRIAIFNSVPGAQIIEHAPVPKWGWGQTPPFEPQTWDAPDAAEQGRVRHAKNAEK
jgi:CDGSH-type Zn-finger protein/truncated hemoglobin YjbI/ferredoxin